MAGIGWPTRTSAVVHHADRVLHCSQRTKYSLAHGWNWWQPAGSSISLAASRPESAGSRP